MVRRLGFWEYSCGRGMKTGLDEGEYGGSGLHAVGIKARLYSRIGMITES